MEGESGSGGMGDWENERTSERAWKAVSPPFIAAMDMAGED